jgi:hypothetical protein
MPVGGRPRVRVSLFYHVPVDSQAASSAAKQRRLRAQGERIDRADSRRCRAVAPSRDRPARAAWAARTHTTRDPAPCPSLVRDGQNLLGTKRGYLHVLAAGREKKQLAKIRLDSGIFATPIVANGVFYVATMTRLYAIKGQSGSGTSSAPRER